MGLSINQNIMAMNSYRNLSLTQSGLSKSLEKLSSGFRINRAADDAAGLAISEGLRSQVGGNKQAVRNAQDGISVVQTAEGALNEVHSILQRMRDLAVQGANDSNDSKARNNINTELNQLRDELERVGNVTNFNGTKLLDGTASGAKALKFQVGANGTANDAITIDLKDADVTAISNFNKKVEHADVFKLEGTEAVGNKKYMLQIGGKTAELDFTSGAPADAKELKAALANAINNANISGFVEGGEPTIKSKALDSADSLAAATTNVSKWSLDIGGEKVEFDTTLGEATPEAVAQGLNQKISENGTLKGNYEVSFDKDNKQFSVHAKGQAAEHQVDVKLTTTDTNTVDASHSMTNKAGEVIVGKVGIASGGEYKFEVSDDLKISVSRTDGGAFNRELANTFTEEGATPGTTDVNKGFKLLQADGKTEAVDPTGTAATVSTLTVVDHRSAQELIGVLDNKIQSVSTARSNLGAVQNRFEHTINNLNVAVENLSASESRIRDTDMAQEMMQFTRNQILSQAGTAMLAQANQVPQGVLSLLR